MEDLIAIRQKVAGMAELAFSMLKATFDGFIKHDLDILSGVLRDEERLNDLERTLTISLVSLSKEKISAEDKKNIMLLADIIGDLEEVGDYIKDMIERIEIKIQEKLLFSDEALKEYKHLYSITEVSLQDIVNSLTMNDSNFAKRALCDGEHVDNLVEKYRQAHTQRLIDGVCAPRACNMFLNLLDFTAQIFHHTKGIAKNILELQ